MSREMSFFFRYSLGSIPPRTEMIIFIYSYLETRCTFLKVYRSQPFSFLIEEALGANSKLLVTQKCPHSHPLCRSIFEFFSDTPFLVVGVRV